MTSRSERFDPDTSYPAYSGDKAMHSNIGKALSLTLLIVSSLTASVTALAQETHDLVIVNGRVMDPETGLDGVRDESSAFTCSETIGGQAANLVEVF